MEPQECLKSRIPKVSSAYRWKARNPSASCLHSLEEIMSSALVHYVPEKFNMDTVQIQKSVIPQRMRLLNMIASNK
eukprot:c16757_g2_i2 orf=131-358(-)